MSTDPWTQAIWGPIQDAPSSLARLHTTLGMTRQVCDTAITTTPRDTGFDPAAGWAYADGLLAALELATDLDPVAPFELPPTSRDAAAPTIDDLLRHAADLTLELADQLRDHGDLATLRAVAGTAAQLPEAYRVTFGLPW